MADDMLVAFVAGLRRQLLDSPKGFSDPADRASRPLKGWWSEYFDEQDSDGLLLELASRGETLSMVLYRVAEAHLRNGRVLGTTERPLSCEYEQLGVGVGRYCSRAVRACLQRELGVVEPQ